MTDRWAEFEKKALSPNFAVHSGTNAFAKPFKFSDDTPLAVTHTMMQVINGTGFANALVQQRALAAGGRPRTPRSKSSKKKQSTTTVTAAAVDASTDEVDATPVEKQSSSAKKKKSKPKATSYVKAGTSAAEVAAITELAKNPPPHLADRKDQKSGYIAGFKGNEASASTHAQMAKDIGMADMLLADTPAQSLIAALEVNKQTSMKPHEFVTHFLSLDDSDREHFTALMFNKVRLFAAYHARIAGNKRKRSGTSKKTATADASDADDEEEEADDSKADPDFKATQSDPDATDDDEDDDDDRRKDLLVDLRDKKKRKR
jgi:hypothetical protein